MCNDDIQLDAVKHEFLQVMQKFVTWTQMFLMQVTNMLQVISVGYLANHLCFLNGITCELDHLQSHITCLPKETYVVQVLKVHLDLPWLLALISVSWLTFEFSSHIYSLYSPRACNVFLLILKLLLVLYRRYIAMVEMCQVIGSRDQLIGLVVPLAEQVLNVILIHFQDRWTWKQRSILVFIFTFMSFWDWMLFFFLS